MNLYKFLQVENHQLISDKIYNYIVNRTKILSTKYDWNNLNVKDVAVHVPELFEACAKLVPYEIEMLSVIYRDSGDDGKIHVDDGIRIYRLLWPIKNCQGSYTKFYDIGNNKIERRKNLNGNTFLTIVGRDPYTLIDSVELTQPLVFHTKTAHGVFTNQLVKEPRISITIGFADNPIDKILF
jgi:hypothetical protein